MEARNRMLDQAHHLFHHGVVSEILPPEEGFDKLGGRRGLNAVSVVPQQLKLRNSA